MIVGAGDAAQLILREMLKNPALGYTPIGLVDDAQEEPPPSRHPRPRNDERARAACSATAAPTSF